MKIIVTTLFTLLAMSCIASAELLQNGGFSEKVKYWNLNRHPHYGFETSAAVSQGELQLSDLRETKSGYFVIQQPINIQYGKTYTLTLELKATAGQILSCSIGDYPADSISYAGIKLATDDWETFTIELAGECDTNEKWFKKSLSNARKSKLTKEGVTSRVDAKKRADPLEEAGETFLSFGIGGVKGAIAFRKISLVEVK